MESRLAIWQAHLRRILEEYILSFHSSTKAWEVQSMIEVGSRALVTSMAFWASTDSQ
jgi:hypothetical protein